MRFLAIYRTPSRDIRCAMIDDASDSSLPYGCTDLGDKINDGDADVIALVEMPNDDFRPEVTDFENDCEAAMTFVTL